MKKYYAAMIVGWLCLVLSFAYVDDQARKSQEEIDKAIPITAQAHYEPITYISERNYTQPEPIQTEEEVVETVLTDEEIEMIARLTYAEAGNQEEEGIRLVIDAVLNRVDHPRFPSSVKDVIWQPYQFSPMWNGGYNAAILRDDILDLVRQEAKKRTDHDVIFFNAVGYSYGTPLFKIGAHYFSSYE